MNWIKNHKEGLLNILLFSIGLIIALLIGEVICRRFCIIEKNISDPILTYRGNPAAGYDKNGFRNIEVLDKAEVAVIGDSQTEGNNASIDETWPKVLSDLSGKKVYQFAFGGYGPVQYYSLLKDALKLSPDIVIVGFYTGNDLFDVVRIVYQNDYWKDLRTPGFSLLPDSPSVPVDAVKSFKTGYSQNSIGLKFLKFREWIRKNSYLYAFLGDSTRVLREKLNLAETKEEKIENLQSFAKENPQLSFTYTQKPIDVLLSPWERVQTIDLENPEAKEGWRIAQKLFLEMKKITDNQKIKLVLAIIPTKEMVYGEYFKKYKPDLETTEAMQNFWSKEQNLKDEFFKFCSINELNCVNTTNALVEKLYKGEQIYPHTTDGHPIATGYQTIAESIYNYLKDNNLLQ